MEVVFQDSENKVDKILIQEVGDHICVLSGCARGAGRADVVQQLFLLRHSRQMWAGRKEGGACGRFSPVSDTRTEPALTLISILACLRSSVWC